MNQRLLEAAKPVAGRKAGECPDCMGNALSDCNMCKVHRCHGDKEMCPPCPTCTRLREIAEWCEHRVDTFKPDVIKTGVDTATAICQYCKQRISATYKNVGCMFLVADNPTFTIQSVKALLIDLDGFLEFRKWLWQREMKKNYYNHTYTFPQYANILTSDELIIEAACKFLEGLNA